MQTDMSQAHPRSTQTSVQPDGSDASGEIDDFIYLISHDVRASVRALLELPQWITEDLEEAGIDTGGSVGTSIALMNRHTGRLDRMLVDLLSFSRVGRMQTARAMSLGTALDDVLEQMLLSSGFQITRDLQCDTVVIGDKDLPLLLSALISNAVKHYDQTAGRIHISSTYDGERLTLKVADDGPGIEQKFHDRVFAPMTTLRPRDEVEGSGMGLASVRKIARHYGGDARIGTSPFRRGTSVEITIAVPQ